MALRAHQVDLPDLFLAADQQANISLSEVIPDEVHAFVDSCKSFLATVETDIRDAKRRISLVKTAVPKKKAKPTHGSASEVGSDDGSESGSGGD